MTPKEKAEELVDRFEERFPLKSEVNTTKGDLSWEYDNWEEAKQCALIAVDELIKETGKKWWYDVKLEIEKL
jgi:hypothetical protein